MNYATNILNISVMTKFLQHFFHYYLVKIKIVGDAATTLLYSILI